MSGVHQAVGKAVQKARDQAREVLRVLEIQGHPETGQSNALYLALVSLQKRLLAVDPPPAPIATFIAELQQLARDCEGKLAPVKPLIDDALKVARGSAR